MTMISKSNVVLIVIFFSFSGSESLEIGKDLPLSIRHLKCPRNNTKTCFIENGNQAIPLIAKGVPDYGIPNMIPFRIPYINLISTPTLQLNLTNIEVYGLEKMKIIGQVLDDKKHIYTVILRGDNITVVGDYETDGRILVMPLRGKGRFNFYFKNGIYKSSTYLKMIKKEGDLYFKPIDSRLETKFEKIEFKLENLFDGDKRLGDTVNTFLNENWEPLVADFGPAIEQTVAGLIKEIFDNLASRVPLKNYYT